MNIWIIIKVAVKALMSNKMRAILTMLGIIIGVGSVIGMMAIATGAQNDMTSRIESSGTNMLSILAHSKRKHRGVSYGRGNVRTLTVKDCEDMMKYCNHVAYSSPQLRVVGRAIYRNQNWSTSVRAGNEHYAEIRKFNTIKGRFFTKQEVQSAAKVCVIGDIVKDNLFGDEDPVGKIIRINKIPFTVIGLLESKGQSGFQGSFDDLIIIPYTTAMQRMYKESYLPGVVASATDREDISKAKEEVSQLLRQKHRIKEGEEDDFEIRTQEDRLEMAGNTSRFLSLFLGAVASVSLLVGGIGIMNIMLVSVTERVREIGIRMAIGATQRDIMMQFVTEAVVLSCLGGVLGIGLGYAAAWIIKLIAKWQTAVSIQSIILSVSFSAAIGLFFGLYPAWKASRLDPIEALRNE